MEPYSPVARGGNLIVLKIQELVGGYIIRHDILAVSLHHYGEDDAMEHDVVFTNEVNQTGILILPPLFPVAPLLRILFAELLGV